MSPIFGNLSFLINELTKNLLSPAPDIREKTPFEIVFYDSYSTYQPTINFLKSQENDNKKVYWSKTNNHKGIINAVKDYLKKNKKCKYFVITDPDIELDNVNSDILDFYKFLLNKFRVTSVGPMLRIDDIPNFYPYKKKVISSHTKQFWNKKPIGVKYKNQTFPIQFSPIDTTFQLFSRNNIPNDFPNSKCIRCYSPYSARHLDWYINDKKLSPDQIYYSRNATNIAHWGKFHENLN